MLHHLQRGFEELHTLVPAIAESSGSGGKDSKAAKLFKSKTKAYALVAQTGGVRPALREGGELDVWSSCCYVFRKGRSGFVGED